jgi:hypothetical protein
MMKMCEATSSKVRAGISLSRNGSTTDPPFPITVFFAACAIRDRLDN